MENDRNWHQVQAFLEARFNAMERRQDDTLRLIAASTGETRAELVKLTGAVETTNGRVRKAEVAIAVLRFAVFTIGGALLLAALQIVVARMGS